MSAAGFAVSEAEHDPAGVYRAMLAAAPSPPASPAAGPGLRVVDVAAVMSMAIRDFNGNVNTLVTARVIARRLAALLPESERLAFVKAAEATS